ncbi:SCAN domain-containing protein 3-like [Macrobrachium rosenbergii]|uniref:SCAN domain-containing protein 3-like n=1 Tax=Macrobrachium rosenbergii TaxID=79674 RepID=UPI0034D3B8A1
MKSICWLAICDIYLLSYLFVVKFMNMIEIFERIVHYIFNHNYRMATTLSRGCYKGQMQDLWDSFTSPHEVACDACFRKKHMDTMKSSGSKLQVSIKDSLQPVVNDPTKVAELKLAVFVTEHSSNLSIDHLSELIPLLDPKSCVLKKIKLHRTKCSRLQKYVLAPDFTKLLIEEIRDQPFSLIVDESTNEAKISCLALSIRFFSPKKEAIVDTFYRLVPLKNATAENVHKTVKDCLEEDSLDIHKMIGIGTDGANSMVGRTHSLITLLRQDNPEVTLIKCVCHSLHLAASKACDGLPIILDYIVKETHTWFANSPKRMRIYTELYQVLENSVPKKVPGLASTRWLSRLEAVCAILDQWDALKLHFNISATSERCHTAHQLSNAYKDPQNKLYLLFVRKTLREVVIVNKLFQGQNVDITKLTEDLLDMYRNIMQIVVEPGFLSKCPKVNLPNLKYMNYLLPLNVINFGYDFNTFANACPLNDNQIMYVKDRCQKYLLELLNQIQMRLPDNVETLLMLKKLHPAIATSQLKDSIVPIAIKYKSTFTDMDSLENEWNSVSFDQWPESCLKNSVCFWSEVRRKKNSAGEPKYPNISSLALSLFTLPFSNASVERIFSQMNVVHSKLRNRFSVRSVEAILQIRYGLSLQGKSCVNFEPSLGMLKNFNAKGNVESDEDQEEIVSLELD